LYCRSIFCAKAGAKKVIAIDATDVIKQAQEIVELNGYSNVITCVRGKVESLIENKSLPLEEGETVDIIVSEWMGYALFFETMLPSVMVARDALMTPHTGTMYPNVARVFIEAANDQQRLSYWDNVHGINMKPMKQRMVEELTRDALVEVVDDKNIITNRAELIVYDLNTCRDEELDFEATFELRLTDGATENGSTVEVHQLVVSFDIDFSVQGTTSLSFSTGCQSIPTHWKQAVLWFDPLHNCPILNRKENEMMRGKFLMKRNENNHRAIDMKVMWETGSFNEDKSIWKRTADGILKRSLEA
jgi:protein arginine N-methyltransferase 1